MLLCLKLASNLLLKALKPTPYDANQKTPADCFQFKMLHTGCVLTHSNFQKASVPEAQYCVLN